MNSPTNGATILRRQSKSGASECGWHLLSPGSLEKARGRVQLIAWLMLGVMVLGAVVDFVRGGYFMGDEVRQSIDVVWVASAIFVVAMTLGLLIASSSTHLSHVYVLHLALAYEVGACLFMSTFVTWLLIVITGQVPYVSWGKSAVATVMMHVNADPSPPSSCGVQPIPPAMDEIVMASLEQDPANRPQTADALAEMLSACDTVVAWTRQLANEWWEKNAPVQNQSTVTE